MSAVVLNVEDNLDDRLLLKHAWRKSQPGFELYFAEDGEAALDYLLARGQYVDRDQHPVPSLILLDLKMPRMDGFEVLHWLKQDQTFKSIPVAIFTSSTNTDDIQRAANLGADCYVAKPLRYETLVSFMSRLDALLQEKQQNVSTALSALPECCITREASPSDPSKKESGH
jgi:CheY-like chemotaxis protein